jgi:hypothetical protein
MRREPIAADNKEKRKIEPDDKNWNLKEMFIGLEKRSMVWLLGYKK